MTEASKPTSEHDHKGYSAEKCVRCGWVMGQRQLNCQNDDTPHVFPSQLRLEEQLQSEIALKDGLEAEAARLSEQLEATQEALREAADANPWTHAQDIAQEACRRLGVPFDDSLRERREAMYGGSNPATPPMQTQTSADDAGGRAPGMAGYKTLPPDLVRVLRDPTITIQLDHEIRLADGRTLFEHLEEWRNAPSNTASAGPNPATSQNCSCGHASGLHRPVKLPLGDYSTACQVALCECRDWDGPEIVDSAPASGEVGALDAASPEGSSPASRQEG